MPKYIFLMTVYYSILEALQRPNITMHLVSLRRWGRRRRKRGLEIPYTRSIIETDRQTADSLETNIFLSRFSSINDRNGSQD